MHCTTKQYNTRQEMKRNAMPQVMKWDGIEPFVCLVLAYDRMPRRQSEIGGHVARIY